MVTFGISTWSIHRALQQQRIDLLDVPAALQARGMTDLQICHFHLRSHEDAFLAELRRRVESKKVTLDALLIDFGDLSNEESGERDAAEMEAWLRTAAKLGARFARISAGASVPSEAAMQRSATSLMRLADLGDRLGVRVITENWHPMLASARDVEQFVDFTRGRVPLCLDFGNWLGEGKYDQLEAIAPWAVTVHAKCAFTALEVPDATDFIRCCEVLRRANYDGTIALIYDGPSDDEWHHIAQELALARAAFAT